jgi:hypothetical protein
VYELKLIQGSKSREHDFVKPLTFEECRKIRSNILTSSKQRMHLDAVMDQALQLSQPVTSKYPTLIKVQTVDRDGAKWKHLFSLAEIVSGPDELEATLVRAIGCRHIVNRDFTIGFFYGDGTTQAIHWVNVGGFRRAFETKHGLVMMLLVKLDWKP